jgi:hypothetical protein
MLTQKEIYIIEAIVANSYCSNNYKLPSYELSYEEAASEEVWADTIDDNGAIHGQSVSGKEISGVVSSLNKKGFVVSDGKGREACVFVTEEGWAAYQEVARNNFQGV